MKELPVRKQIRLKNYDYSQSGCYFVTICVKDKHELLGTIVGAPVPSRQYCVLEYPEVELTELGYRIESAITYYNANSIAIIDKYVIMPNHIHMIIVIRQTAGDRGRGAGDRGRSPLQEIVRNLKSYVTKTAGFSPWQRSFHDHIIRNDEDYLRIWKYIDENPARWSEDKYYVKPRATGDGRRATEDGRPYSDGFLN